MERFTYRGGFAPHIGTVQNTMYCLEYELGSLESCGAIFFGGLGWQGLSNRAIYSNSAENFKRLTNPEDSSDLDENLTEPIAATQTFI